MAKEGHDPCKGIEKGLKTAQDKLLDIARPLTQALVLTDEAISQGIPLDPMLIWDWRQQYVCLLGNVNSSLLAERRRAVLLRMDRQLAGMADKELCPSAEGFLFGERFASELRKHTASSATLNKVES